MPPVTLKNNQLHDTLYLAQGLITLSTAIIIWLSITQSYFFILTIPLLVWAFRRNHITIHKNKQFNIVMNAECEWRLVHIDTSKVIEAKLINHWYTPTFMIIHLRTEPTNYHPLILRKNTEPVAYSRLLQGVLKKAH